MARRQPSHRCCVAFSILSLAASAFADVRSVSCAATATTPPLQPPNSHPRVESCLRHRSAAAARHTLSQVRLLVKLTACPNAPDIE